MHPLNRVLSLFGLTLSRTTKQNSVPAEFRQKLEACREWCKRNSRGFDVREELYDDGGDHPVSHIDAECAFAAEHLAKRNAKSILDVGSYRHFVLGVLAHSKVTTVDIRNRAPFSVNENIMTCDAKRLQMPDNSVDAVVSLCALEHFGLGRYGDEFDLDADTKAFDEMVRVLKPDGFLIFTTTITNARPSIAFNAHRIYNHEMIRRFCHGLKHEDSKFYSHSVKGFCPLEQVTTAPGVWDIYLGCWSKDPEEN